MKNIKLGILGGGQLGRMSALAAANLGIETFIFTPETECPASYVSAETIIAEYSDEAALSDFASKVDFIGYEFENIPVKTVAYLQTLKPVHPEKRLLEVSQDRIEEKTFLNSIDIETTRWKKYEGEKSLENASSEWKCDTLILKTVRFGYDGKGQIKWHNGDSISDTIRQLNGDMIIEDIVDFMCEISVIVACDAYKNMITYGPMLNHHRNHILHKTIVPAAIEKKIKEKAIEITKHIANEINLRGVLTVEFFVTTDGRVLVNEIAPRTHNSGHWTIDACAHSQFENHVRAVCGLPVLPPHQHSDAEMLNLIGEEVRHIDDALCQENACVHLYGKHDIREGRKMGHITFLSKKTT